MRYKYPGIFFLLFSLSAIAQENRDSSNKEKSMGEVVVTGQYKPQSVKNSVYQVRVITKERIQKQGAVKLQDVLSNELNIRFSQDIATGGSNITMMGLSGQNVKILLDGMPLIGRQGTSNEININQIDVNSIERIEIVEGPMSVVYGADALAGVINIITKKSSASKISVTARAQEETVGKEYGVKGGIHTQYGGLTWRDKNWEAGGGIGYNYFGGWKGDSTGRELTWHWKDQIIGNGFIGYNSHKFNIRYRFDGLDEIITNPGNYTLYQQDADDWLAPDQEYLTRRVMQQLQSSYFVNNNLSFQGQAAFTNYSRQVFSTTVSQSTGKVSMDLSDGAQAIDKFTGFTFRGTAQYKISPVFSLQPGVDINMETGKGQRLKAGDDKVNDYAFFITSEITPTSKINIRPGLRFIKNSVYDAPPVIPSINTKFSLSKALDLRLAYARGFRSPSIRELYFNFFDANHQIIGNPDLKAETSNSFTGSLSWKKPAQQHIIFGSSLSGFYNKVKNMIDYAISASDPNVYILTNVFNSKTAGLSLTGTADHKQWNVSLGIAYTGFYNIYSETDKSTPQMQWSPEINSSLGYKFTKLGLDMNLFYKLTGRKPFYIQEGPDIALSRQKGYNWADFTMNKKVCKYFTINAGIRNLFNVITVNSTVAANGVHTSNGISSIGYGRSYFAGLAFNWDKK